MTRYATLGALLLIAAPVRADVTGSFSGSVTGKKVPQAVSAAAVFSQTGKSVSGTVALAPGAPLGGAYLVSGIATPKIVKVKTAPIPGSTRLMWKGKIVGDTLQGKVKVKGAAGKLLGTLALTRNVSTGDGSSCDAVYTQNQALFDGEVLAQGLTTCTSCHQPGLQAGATRLHVTRADPLATARSVALLVDPAQPVSSPLLQKPLNLVPHGGGLQLMAGGTAAQLLQQWAELIAASGCR